MCQITHRRRWRKEEGLTTAKPGMHEKTPPRINSVRRKKATSWCDDANCLCRRGGAWQFKSVDGYLKMPSERQVSSLIKLPLHLKIVQKYGPFYRTSSRARHVQCKYMLSMIWVGLRLVLVTVILENEGFFIFEWNPLSVQLGNPPT